MREKTLLPRFWWIWIPTPFRVTGALNIEGIGVSWYGHDAHLHFPRCCVAALRGKEG